MNFPVHRDNLVSGACSVKKDYICIRHSYYGEQWLEVWKRLIGPYFRHVETFKLDLPNTESIKDEE